jgi:hypothetical protein
MINHVELMLTARDLNISQAVTVAMELTEILKFNAQLSLSHSLNVLLILNVHRNWLASINIVKILA